jgi:Lar family restriction alleviation protein
MSEQAENIQPCPFCGCDDNFDFQLIGETSVQMECKECLARGPAIRRYSPFPHGKIDKEDKGLATVEWNRRFEQECEQ